MKTDLHPDYTFVSVKLADGTEYMTRSTMTADTYAAEIDSSNHPFYTGKKTMVDTAGRVERFRRRYGNTHATQLTANEEAAQAEEAAAAAAEPVDVPDTDSGDEVGQPVPGTGKPPASSPDNPARDTEKTDGPVPTTTD